MKLHADHHFHIGVAHLNGATPCQDYALSKVQGRGRTNSDLIQDRAVAIVSDGCSTGRNTDIGARLISWTTMNSAFLRPSPIEVTRYSDLQMRMCSESLGANQDDLLATRVWCYADTEPHDVFAHIQGDGVIALRFTNGNLKLYRFEWSNNTPYYPVYGAQQPNDNDNDNGNGNGNGNGFAAVHGGLGKLAFTVQHQWISGPAPWGCVDSYIENLTTAQGVVGYVVSPDRYPALGIDVIAVFTDGVTQVDNVSWVDAVTSLMSFKTFEGEFVKRRLSAAIRNWSKLGRGPIDDISMAAIRIEHESQDDIQSGRISASASESPLGCPIEYKAWLE